MAKYAGFDYNLAEDGGKLYGGAPIPSLSVGNFTALVIDYDEVNLEWSNPAGNIRRVRVIRNQEGIPDTQEDGVILRDEVYSPVTTRQKLTDNGIDYLGNEAPLIRGRHVYYSVWLWLEDDDNRWYLAGSTYSTIPSEHIVLEGTGAESTTHTRLMESLPKVMTSADMNAFGVVDYDGDLAKFLKAMSFTMDQLMTLTDLLLPNSTFVNFTPELLNSYALNVGISTDAVFDTTPTKFQRMLLRNALLIYQEKGTPQALSMFVEAVTGYNVQLSETTNLMLTAQDATFYDGTGNWVAGAGTTLTSSNNIADTAVPDETEVEENEITYRIDSQYFGKVVTSTTSGLISNGNFTPITTGVPVEAEAVYVVSFYQKSATTANYTVTVTWYDYLGNAISEEESDPLAATTDWSRIEFSANTAPAGAKYAGITIAFSAAATYYLDMINFALEYYPQFSEARGVGVALSPSKRNLILNPSFENDTENWVVTGGTESSVAYSGNLIPGQYSGDSYLLVESVADDDVTVFTETDASLVEARPITLSLFSQFDGTAPEVTVRVEAYAVGPSSDNYVDTTTPTSGSTTGWTWTDATGGTATISYPTSGGPVADGANVLVEYSAQPTSGDQVISIDSTGLTADLVDGAEYTFSIYINPAETRTVYPSIEWGLLDGDPIEESGDSVEVVGGEWTKVTYSVTAPAGVDTVETLSLTVENNSEDDFGLAYAEASLSPVSYYTEKTLSSLDGSWTRDSLTLDIPSTEGFAIPLKVAVTLSYTSNGNDFRVDAVQVEQSELATDYFDGSFFNAEWSLGLGAAHASSSNMYNNKENKLAVLERRIRDFIPMNTPFWVETESGVAFNGVFKYYA